MKLPLLPISILLQALTSKASPIVRIGKGSIDCYIQIVDRQIVDRFSPMLFLFHRSIDPARIPELALIIPAFLNDRLVRRLVVIGQSRLLSQTASRSVIDSPGTVHRISAR